MTISLAPFDSQSASLWQADYSLRAFDVRRARHERAVRLAGGEL